jgi:fatty acid/phospholipid biosynthesis enzyme
VDGVCVISHGRSTAKAIKNAVRAAAGCVSSSVIAHIRKGIAVAGGLG